MVCRAHKIIELEEAEKRLGDIAGAVKSYLPKNGDNHSHNWR